MLNAGPSNRYITEHSCSKAKSAILRKGCTISEKLIDRGLSQAANFWTSADGSQDEFIDFCAKNFCKNLEEKDRLFERLCTNFETILGHNNRVTIELLRPSHVKGIESTPVDDIFGAYNGLAHFNEDMFNNKLAFIVIMNFPHFTLREKVNNGDNWTIRQWGYVRLGDLFTNRAPASAEQSINAATAAAENYIANYNIHMGMVWSDKNIRYWSQDVKLITHWGLRDELKAAYSDPVSGTDKQSIIYNILTRITDQTIAEDVIDKSDYIWYPSTNQTYVQRVEIKGKSENNKRYECLLRNFRAIKASDEYYEEDNFITRTTKRDPIFSSLIDNLTFRDALYARMLDFANDTFNPERVNAFVDDYAARMRHAMGNEYRRFMHDKTEEDFMRSCEDIKAFFQLRHDYILEAFGGK